MRYTTVLKKNSPEHIVQATSAKPVKPDAEKVKADNPYVTRMQENNALKVTLIEVNAMAIQAKLEPIPNQPPKRAYEAEVFARNNLVESEKPAITTVLLHEKAQKPTTLILVETVSKPEIKHDKNEAIQTLYAIEVNQPKKGVKQPVQIKTETKQNILPLPPEVPKNNTQQPDMRRVVTSKVESTATLPAAVVEKVQPGDEIVILSPTNAVAAEYIIDKPMDVPAFFDEVIEKTELQAVNWLEDFALEPLEPQEPQETLEPQEPQETLEPQEPALRIDSILPFLEQEDGLFTNETTAPIFLNINETTPLLELAEEIPEPLVEYLDFATLLALPELESLEASPNNVVHEFFEQANIPPLPPVCVEVTKKMMELDPSPAAVASEILASINTLVTEVINLRISSSETAPVAEQKLEQMCIELFEYLGIEYTPETVMEFVQGILQTRQNIEIIVEKSNDKLESGTHEIVLEDQRDSSSLARIFAFPINYLGTIALQLSQALAA